MPRLLPFVALVLALVVPSAALGQSTTEYVSFPSMDKGLTGGLSATLYRPTGSGPFPAIVLLHPCGGIHPFVLSWGQWFAGNGYEAVVVDSFGPRNVTKVCEGGRPDQRTRAFDAYGALAYLRTRKDVDATRIGVIGWSHGGGAVLVSDDKTFADSQAQSGGFRAAIALYPPCKLMPQGAVAAPLLLLLGDSDQWNPPGPCEHAAQALSAQGDPITVHLYHGASHGFSNESSYVNNVRRRPGAQSKEQYDAEADRDAHNRVAGFLASALK